MIYILSGIPASGKTTYGKILSQKHNAVLISYDDIPDANTTVDKMSVVYNRWISQIRELALTGKGVVCDNTNLTVKQRKKLFERLKDIPCRKELCVMTTPLNECFERNKSRDNRLPEFVLIQSYERFEYPTDSEGWDKITYI